MNSYDSLTQQGKEYYEEFKQCYQTVDSNDGGLEILWADLARLRCWIDEANGYYERVQGNEDDKQVALALRRLDNVQGSYAKALAAIQRRIGTTRHDKYSNADTAGDEADFIDD